MVGIIWRGLTMVGIIWRGSGDDVGRGFGSVEVGHGEVVRGKLGRGELGHGLMAWIPTR